MKELPNPELIKDHLKLVNYQNIILDRENQTVFLKEKGMRIGFGGIGKGYAAEMAKQMLQNRGVTSGIVNASGDLTTWGNQADGKPWTVGIADPDNAKQPFSYMNITNMAVATSGNYEKFVIINGKKYSHTINPKTGMPVSGVKKCYDLLSQRRNCRCNGNSRKYYGNRCGAQYDQPDQSSGMHHY
jgi:thiamine biosynthesis lipoprotein